MKLSAVSATIRAGAASTTTMPVPKPALQALGNGAHESAVLRLLANNSNGRSELEFQRASADGGRRYERTLGVFGEARGRGGPSQNVTGQSVADGSGSPTDHQSDIILIYDRVLRVIAITRHPDVRTN
jgi:hypothetical protein